VFGGGDRGRDPAAAGQVATAHDHVLGVHHGVDALAVGPQHLHLAALVVELLVHDGPGADDGQHRRGDRGDGGPPPPLLGPRAGGDLAPLLLRRAGLAGAAHLGQHRGPQLHRRGMLGQLAEEGGDLAELSDLRRARLALGQVAAKGGPLDVVDRVQGVCPGQRMQVRGRHFRSPPTYARTIRAAGSTVDDTDRSR
jgi:hypothetical protein